MSRKKLARREVPIETPWMLAESLARAQDPYHHFLSPWPRGPVGRGSLDVPEEPEETLDEVDERMQAAEQLAREEISEQIKAFRTRTPPPPDQRCIETLSSDGTKQCTYRAVKDGFCKRHWHAPTADEMTAPTLDERDKTLPW